MVLVVVGKMGRRSFALSALGFVALGCASAAGAGAFGPAAPRVPLGSPSTLRGALFRYRFAIYVPQRPALAVAELIATAAATHGFLLAGKGRTEAAAAHITRLSFAEPSIDELAPPSEQHVRYFSIGLTAEEQRELAACRYVLSVEVAGPSARAFVDYRRALVMHRELAEKLGGYLWDQEVRIAYNLQSAAPRTTQWAGGAPFVNDHVTLHVYRDGDLLRLVSLGMVKLGLPDVAVSRVPESSSTRMAKLLDLVLQRVAEGAAPDASGNLRASLDEVTEPQAKAWLEEDLDVTAKRSITVALVESRASEVDSSNRVWELEFPGDEAHLHERQTEALVQLFGDTPR